MSLSLLAGRTVSPNQQCFSHVRILGQTSTKQWITCLAQEHNTVHEHLCKILYVLNMQINSVMLCNTAHNNVTFTYDKILSVLCQNTSQESIQSITTPDQGHCMGKWQKHKKTSHTREPRGQPFPSRWPQGCKKQTRPYGKDKPQITKVIMK